MKWHDETILTLAASMMLVGAGALAAASAIDNEPGRGWLYDFQTLVTGFLAVGGAGIAVLATRWQDQRQQDRHNEVLGLSLRMDRLRARRAAFPYAEEIETKAAYVLKKVRMAREALSGEDYGTFKQEVGFLLRARNDLLQTIADDSIVEARNMFGSGMSHTYKAVLDTLNAEGAATAAVLGYASDYNSDAKPNDYVATHAEAAIENSRRAALGCLEFTPHLRKLASHYDNVPGAETD